MMKDISIIETVKAVNYSDSEIILANVNDLQKVYRLINDNERFIISWSESGSVTEGGAIRSKLIIPGMLLPKIENGELVLSSRQF